jgi:hypothetical protein
LVLGCGPVLVPNVVPGILARICYILETSVEYHRMGGTSVWSKRKLEFGSLLQFFIIIIIIIRVGCDSGQQGGTSLFYRKLTC